MLDRIGDKWSVLVIESPGKGTHRFSDLQRGIDGGQAMHAFTDMSRGSFAILVERPIAGVLLAVAVLIIVAPALVPPLRKALARRPSEVDITERRR